MLKYQNLLQKMRLPGGEPVVAGIQWESTEPKVDIFHDDSPSRDSLLERCTEQIVSLAGEKKNVMVSIFAHGSFRHSLEKSIDRENVTFGSAYNVLGCQYQCVIVVLDISSCVPPTRNLVNAMTRATTSLHFIVNSVQTPMLINELPTFHCDPDCQEKEVEDRSGEETYDGKSYEEG